MVGQLSVVAAADLGGLGSREGRAAIYPWVPTHLASAALPWLLALGLLAVRPNRAPGAWWIWVPLLLVTVPLSVVRSELSAVPAEVADLGTQVVSTLAFAAATAWLLSPYLSRPSRVETFFAVFGAIVIATGAMALAFLSTGEEFQFGVALAFAGTISAIALGLTLVCCWRRYRPARLLLWLVGWLLLLWLAVIGPFMIFALVMTGDSGPGIEVFTVVPIVAGVCLVGLLPFLLLAFVQPFYRDRLQRLLGAQPLPAVAPSLVEAG